jgi:hypothetical protein
MMGKKGTKQKQLLLDTDSALNNDTVYKAVDALGFTLYQMGDCIKGACPMEYDLGDGFWKTTSDWVVESDQLDGNVYSFFCRTKGGLWMYLIAGGAGLWMILFDGDHAKIKAPSIAEFKTKNIRQTLAKLKGSTRESYSWDKVSGDWLPVDVMSALGA